MSSTRLLVLGAVKIMQPVHGYDVRRELISWGVKEWMATQPGSIYSALKTLEKDALISVALRPPGQGRPEKTLYELTVEGEKVFQSMLRAAWWRVENPVEPLLPAMSLMEFMSRDELIAAVGSRIAQLDGQIAELRFMRATIADGATGADGGVPEHVREILDFTVGRLKAELVWSKGFVGRLRDGAYVFSDEGAFADRYVLPDDRARTSD
ncbi:MAG: PadR family transcriptional regulator [Ilumatobacteraceae bacterium]